MPMYEHYLRADLSYTRQFTEFKTYDTACSERLAAAGV